MPNFKKELFIMFRTALLFSIVCLFAFSSCKKTGSPKACFTFSKPTVKIGDTLYLLNCSENFQKFIWKYPGGTIDSMNRHTVIVPNATGTFEVALYVGKYEFTSADFGAASESKQSFVVE